MKSFEGQVALVTGAGGGIGLAAASAFAEAGASVIMADSNTALLEEAASALRSAGHEVSAVTCDVRDRNQVRAMTEQAVKAYGRLDAAFNNAGINCDSAPMLETGDEAFDTILDVNLRGIWNCMKAELRQMIAQGSGAIVNCSSIGGMRGTRHQLVQERVEAMRVIWTQDRAEYHGAFVNFGPMLANPKPVQKPYPPVIVGGSYPYAARRAVRYGDGWYALTGEKYGDEFAFIPKFQDMLAQAGRDRSTCPITICLYPEELDAFAPDQVGALARYEALGVTRCIVGFNADKREAILPVLDRWAAFMRST